MVQILSIVLLKCCLGTHPRAFKTIFRVLVVCWAPIKSIFPYLLHSETYKKFLAFLNDLIQNQKLLAFFFFLKDQIKNTNWLQYI